MFELTDMVVNATKRHKYDGTLTGWKYEWTFQNALLYTITIMSTIGYGHVSPSSLGGKICTMLYALVGVALLIVSTAKFGNFLAKSIRMVYRLDTKKARTIKFIQYFALIVHSRVFCRWFRYQRIREEDRSVGVRKALALLAREAMGSEAYMPSDEIPIPIVISLATIFSYLLIGAFIFADWENWDISSSVYFCFITLTTIGLGDMVPNKSFDISTLQGQIQIGITVLYCSVGKCYLPTSAIKEHFHEHVMIIIGMALVSMCFSLIQENIGQKAAMVAASAGLKGEAEAVQVDVIVPTPRIANFFDHNEN